MMERPAVGSKARPIVQWNIEGAQALDHVYSTVHHTARSPIPCLKLFQTTSTACKLTPSTLHTLHHYHETTTTFVDMLHTKLPNLLRENRSEMTGQPGSTTHLPTNTRKQDQIRIEFYSFSYARLLWTILNVNF